MNGPQPAGPGAPGAAATLRVEVGAHPSPGLLRAAIEARLAGRGWGSGPEAAIADEVARAVERLSRVDHRSSGDGSWR